MLMSFRSPLRMNVEYPFFFRYFGFFPYIRKCSFRSVLLKSSRLIAPNEILLFLCRHQGMRGVAKMTGSAMRC